MKRKKKRLQRRKKEKQYIKRQNVLEDIIQNYKEKKHKGEIQIYSNTKNIVDMSNKENQTTNLVKNGGILIVKSRLRHQ